MVVFAATTTISPLPSINRPTPINTPISRLLLIAQFSTPSKVTMDDLGVTQSEIDRLSESEKRDISTFAQNESQRLNIQNSQSTSSASSPTKNYTSHIHPICTDRDRSRYPRIQRNLLQEVHPRVDLEWTTDKQREHVHE